MSQNGFNALQLLSEYYKNCEEALLDKLDRTGGKSKSGFISTAVTNYSTRPYLLDMVSALVCLYVYTNSPFIYSCSVIVLSPPCLLHHISFLFIYIAAKSSFGFY